jgi:hypothetical protein
MIRRAAPSDQTCQLEESHPHYRSNVAEQFLRFLGLNDGAIRVSLAEDTALHLPVSERDAHGSRTVGSRRLA